MWCRTLVVLAVVVGGIGSAAAQQAAPVVPFPALRGESKAAIAKLYGKPKSCWKEGLVEACSYKKFDMKARYFGGGVCALSVHLEGVPFSADALMVVGLRTGVHWDNYYKGHYSWENFDGWFKVIVSGTEGKNVFFISASHCP